MKKRIISALVAAIMLFSMIPATAAETASVNTQETVVIAAEQAWSKAGTVVEVDVTITGNPGLLGAVINLSWDEEMTLISAVSKEAFSDLTYQAPGRFNPAGTNFVWFGNELETVTDGTVLTLTFQISQTAQEWNQYGVRLFCDENNFYDRNQNTVGVNTVDGSVLVISYTPGDVNNNGEITVQDLILLSQFISDGCITDPEGYNVTLNEQAADVDNSGKINTRDLILISQYISDGGTNPKGYHAILKPSTPRCTHINLEYISNKEPTCTQMGIKEHWYCFDCAKYFLDATGMTETSYEDLKILEIGHTEVIDEAVAPSCTQTGLTEGSHCSVCGEVIIPQEVVDALPVAYHAIIYKNLKGATTPEIKQFTEHEGLTVLPDISVAGYEFMGWYTELEGGTKVTSINAGSTQNVELWAHWKIITYNITYDCKAYSRGNGINPAENKNTYTVEDTVILYDASLQGYFFKEWVDQSGKAIPIIPKGTTGDIILTATWQTTRYLAHPVDEIQDPIYNPKSILQEYIVQDDNSKIYLDQYSFIYYLGYIERVPIGDAMDPILHDNTKNYTEEYYTKDITKSEIVDVTDKITSDTRGWQSTISASVEVEFDAGLVSTTLGTEISHTQSGETKTESNSHNTTTYSQESVKSLSKKAEIKINESPQGWYRLVNMATVDVFSVITYDAKENKLYYTNVNAVRDIFADWDYSAKSQSFDDEYNVQFPFVFPDEVNTFIDSLTYGTPGLKYEIGTDEKGNRIATVIGYDGDAQNVVIPTYWNDTDTTGLRVTGIQESTTASGSVFAEKNITSVELGSYITSIPDYAFYKCKSLKQIKASDKCTSIGNYAFFGCEKIKYDIPEIITSIGDYAFAECESIDTITVTENITVLGENTFMDCGILDMTVIPNNSSVVKAVSGTNATSIKLDLSMLTDGVADAKIIIPDTAEYFEINGAGKVLSNVTIESFAENTVIKNMCIQNTNGEKALLIHSPSTTLHTVDISTDNGGNVTEFTSENADLIICETVTLNGGHSDSIGAVGIRAQNIKVHSAGDISGKLNVTGGNGESAGNAIMAAGVLCFEGYLTVNVIGGNGVTPVTNSSKGSNGAAGIFADTISINVVGSVTASGGNGGKGADGISYTGWKYANGRHGGVGGVGGNGGEALSCATLDIKNASKTSLQFKSGDGGNGGNGGKGECSQAADGNPYVSGNGGIGGQGGTGGTVLRTQNIYIDDSLMLLSVVTGAGGAGGNGGDGGDADKYWFQYSTKGKGANGGSGGIAGLLGFELESFESNSVNVTYGENGSAGTKGDDGVADYAPSSRPQ